MIDGELLAVDVALGTIDLKLDGEENAPPDRRSLAITAETIILLDDKAAKPADLKPGSSIRLRLSEDGKSARAIKATPPEPAEDEARGDADDKVD